MQAHPHLDGAWRERLLTLRRSGQRLDRIGKRVQERVSLRVDLDAAVRGEGAAQEPAVLGERLDIAGLAELLDQPRRALDVGEQEGDNSARKLGHPVGVSRLYSIVKFAPRWASAGFAVVVFPVHRPDLFLSGSPDRETATCAQCASASRQRRRAGHLDNRDHAGAVGAGGPARSARRRARRQQPELRLELSCDDEPIV